MYNPLGCVGESLFLPSPSHDCPTRKKTLPWRAGFVAWLSTGVTRGRKIGAIFSLLSLTLPVLRFAGRICVLFLVDKVELKKREECFILNIIIKIISWTVLRDYSCSWFKAEYNLTFRSPFFLNQVYGTSSSESLLLIINRLGAIKKKALKSAQQLFENHLLNIPPQPSAEASCSKCVDVSRSRAFHLAPC